MFKPLGHLLPGALDRMRVRRPVEATLVCRAVDQALGSQWDHAVPMRAVSYRGGRVTVAVTSSSWAFELMNRAEAVRTKSNELLGTAAITEVRSKVSPDRARGDGPAA